MQPTLIPAKSTRELIALLVRSIQQLDDRLSTLEVKAFVNEQQQSLLGGK